MGQVDAAKNLAKLSVNSSPMGRSRKQSSLAEFYDAEDIVAKIHTVHELVRRHNYGALQGNIDFWNRVNRALEALPKTHRRSALAVFANVIYLSNGLLDEAMSVLSSEAADRCKAHGVLIPDDVHCFTVDHPGLIDKFFNSGSRYGWQGRLDHLTLRDYSLVSHLLKALEDLSDNAISRLDLIQEIFSKKTWILLIDKALSGGSLRSDLLRLISLRAMFKTPDFPIIACTQVITQQSLTALHGLIPSEDIIYGLYFDDRFRVNSQECELFSSEAIRKKVLRFCSWFAKNYLSDLRPESMLYETVRLHRKRGEFDVNFAYGWADGGYTIVSQDNSPTNSLPVLWYPNINECPQAEYVPPFPRSHSRLKQKTAGDSARLQRIQEKVDIIRPLVNKKDA